MQRLQQCTCTHLHMDNRQTLTQAISQPTAAMPPSVNCLSTKQIHRTFCWTARAGPRGVMPLHYNHKNSECWIATAWQCPRTSHLTLAQTQLSFCPLPCPLGDWQLQLLAPSAQLAHTLLSATTHKMSCKRQLKEETPANCRAAFVAVYYSECSLNVI